MLIGVTCAVVSVVFAIAAIVAAAQPKPDPPPATVRIGTAAYAERCPGAQRAIGYYRRAYAQNRARMGLSGPVSRVWYGCDAARRRAVQWRERASDALAAFRAWHARQWAWQTWLPRAWYRLGSCETGYGGPPNWQHRNSSYEGAFGFAVSTWDRYRSEAEARFGDGPYPASAADATPRQQWNVALVVYAHFGMSGWGCRGAYYG